jgi:hypothetical protein
MTDNNDTSHIELPFMSWDDKHDNGHDGDDI